MQNRHSTNKHHTHLFATVRRQIEHQNGQETDAHAGYDQVHSVEKRFPAHRDVERDIQVRFVAARVELFVSEMQTKEDGQMKPLSINKRKAKHRTLFGSFGNV